VSQEKYDETTEENQQPETSGEPIDVTIGGQGDQGAEQEEKSIEEELVDALRESDHLRDQVLRIAADFENYKKRMERERQARLKYEGENILRAMLPVVDNLERALQQGRVDGVDPEKNLEALHEGVKLTLKSLVDTLEKLEVKPVESVGAPFDPTFHEAMSMEASDTIPHNHVVAEFEKGYQYKDRLLRAARVAVSAGAAGGDGTSSQS
jgi:molecular chaperone GrpE